MAIQAVFHLGFDAAGERRSLRAGRAVCRPEDDGEHSDLQAGRGDDAKSI